jgi:hypothetical protein
MTMPAIGRQTGILYQEPQILNPTFHQEMSEQALFRVDLGEETDTQVRPVRNEKSPNFRKVRDSIFKNPVERRENDPTHNRCVTALVQLFDQSSLRIWSNTFEDDGTVTPFGTTLFSQGPSDYKWWQDGGPCRMSAGPENFIQPDICGRSTEVFYPSGRQPNVIVEVINTHPPEFDTFFALLHYSLYNHLVAFYYVAPDSDGSQYSSYRISDGVISLRVAHYLLGGKAYMNGKEVAKIEGSTDRAWFEHLQRTYFGTPVRNKRPWGAGVRPPE